jgi:hypothetical protein
MTDNTRKLDEIEAGLEGVTPGPWRVIIDDDGNPLSGRPSIDASDELDCSIVHWDGFVQEYWRSARGDREIHANAAHIARLDPDTVRELVRLARIGAETEARRTYLSEKLIDVI